MDAITMLRTDHKEVERLFKRFERAKPGAHAERGRIAKQVLAELSRHSTVEEQAFYPAVREAVAEVRDTILESLEEHHLLKLSLDELEGMDPREERFQPKMTVLIETVRHHVREEEEELFPKVRAALGRTALRDLAAVMEKSRRAAPARPRPDAPDTPPGNLTPESADVARLALAAVSAGGIGQQDGRSNGRRSRRAEAVSAQRGR